MLLSISEDLSGRTGISVDERHCVQAREILDWIMRYLPGVYAHLGGSSFGSDHERIYSIIHRSGGSIEDRELGRRMSRKLDRNSLTNHLETMKQNGVIERVRVDPWEGKYGWKIVRKMQ
jgi:TFIIF-interacting CTD phosphatase-like protein